jgi:effector-binding domain-containing protein
MLDVTIKTTEPATVAYISMHGPYDQIPVAMGRLYGWVAQRGLEPAGIPAGIYIDDPNVVGPADATWEVHAPVAGDLAETADSDGFGIKHVDAHLVASVMYKGAYEKVVPAYHELSEWVENHGYKIVGPSEELYYSDPATTEPEDYLTEIRFPVAPH